MVPDVSLSVAASTSRSVLLAAAVPPLPSDRELPAPVINTVLLAHSVPVFVHHVRLVATTAEPLVRHFGDYRLVTGVGHVYLHPTLE